MKSFKITFGILIALFGVISAFVDIEFGVFYFLIIGYIAGMFYLIDNNKFFAALYKEFKRVYGETNALGHFISPLVLAGFLYGSLFLPDSGGFGHLDFFLGWLGLSAIYFLTVFLPAIIRAKRNLR